MDVVADPDQRRRREEPSGYRHLMIVEDRGHVATVRIHNKHLAAERAQGGDGEVDAAKQLRARLFKPLEVAAVPDNC